MALYQNKVTRDYESSKNAQLDAARERETKIRNGGIPKLAGGDMEVEVTDMVMAGPRGDAGLPEEMAASGLPPQRSAPKKPSTGGAMPLKKGTYNNDTVRALQVSLGDIAKASGLTQLDPGAADADFGGKTESAIKAFQEEFGLDVTGMVDDATLEAIQSKQSELMMGGGSLDRSGETNITGESPVDRGAPAQTKPSSADIKEMDDSTKQLLVKYGVLTAEDIAAAYGNS